jgi:signal transduction histidine kinase
VSRLPIRLRLTAAFALAMVLVLVAAGAFVYLRLEENLNESVDTSLEARAAAVATSGEVIAGAAEEGEEGFAQLVSPRTGRVLEAAGGARGPVLGAPALARAGAGGEVHVERRVAGVEGTARVLAKPSDRPAGAVVVVGQSLDDRDETLAGVVASFAIGGPVAVLLASLAGYLLASSALRPVEAMRRRAREISLSEDGERLPLPAAHDEIHRLGNTLNEMIERLRRSFERERRFVADAGHELRSPIAVVKTELEGALRSGDYGPEVAEALTAAVEECDRLAQLAEDLLVVARSGEGALPLRREEVELAPLLEDVRRRFADRAARGEREIVIDGADGLSVNADPLRLRQAVSNLVDNALRHGDGEVSLRARPRDGGLELEVSDRGAGFEPEIANRAFERFTRGDRARTRGGTGLGMAIVLAVAQAHGGRAEIADGGAGGTVRLWLPDATAAQDHLSERSYGASRQSTEPRGGTR